MEKEINIYDLIIVGGGPAGITAGIYASRSKLKTLLITKDFIGQIGNSALVENYPGLEKISGLELMSKLRKHLETFPIETCNNEEVIKISKNNEIFQVETDKGKYLSKTIILAVGRTYKQLNVPGEKELLGKGVSTCSICDAYFFKDKDVAVVGGGNSGCQAVLSLMPLAKKIYLFSKGDKLVCEKIYQDRISNFAKLEILYDIKIKEILGQNQVEGIKAELKNGEEKIFKVDGIFISIGYKPQTDFVKGFVDFDNLGHIIVNPQTAETSQPGVFAAGDVTNAFPKQVVVATSQGATAAISASKYLENK